MTRIIKDSIGPHGVRITTWILEYPRIIHQEVLTHRVFSRNSASSRAIPGKRLLEMVENDPYWPINWPKNQKGMQSSEILENSKECDEIWRETLDFCLAQSKRLHDLGVHKQIANRLVEPFMNMTVLLTGTDFGNFFRLRANKDAQPEFQELAYTMLDLYNKNEPESIGYGEWHIPFDDPSQEFEVRLKIAVARAARLSYVNFEGNISVESDIALFEKLKESGHFSPFEHVAVCSDLFNTSMYGNLRGWVQYRKFMAEENIGDERIQKKEYKWER